MRYFIDSNSDPSLEGDDVKYKVTNCYIEFEYPGDDFFFVLYLIPKTSNSVFIATCWERAFDEILDNLDDEDYVETMTETWPTLARLLANGINDRYSEGALIKLEDFDTGEPKWFLASVCGNLDFENIEEIFGDRTQEVTQLVIQQSLELLQELNENKPSILGAFGKGIVRTLVGGLAVTGIAAVGALFGIDPSYTVEALLGSDNSA